MSPRQARRWALMVAVLGLALSSCYQDRSPKPKGEWRHVVDLTSSDVQFDIWETDSTRDNASCVDVTATPEPFYELPRDAPHLYKGHEAACTFRPTRDNPVNWLWLAENGDNYGLVVAALPADTSATMTLVGGRQVANAVTQDESTNVNYFVGFLDRSERAASLELETPEGKFTCEFVDRKLDDHNSMRDIECPDGP